MTVRIKDTSGGFRFPMYDGEANAAAAKGEAGDSAPAPDAIVPPQESEAPSHKAMLDAAFEIDRRLADERAKAGRP